MTSFDDNDANSWTESSQDCIYCLGHNIQMNIVDCNEFKEDHFFNYLLGNTIHEELVADLKLVKMRRTLTGS